MLAAQLTKTIGAFHDSSNARIRKIGGYTGPNPYVPGTGATGGDPISAADLGMSRIEMIVFTHATNGTLFLQPVWVPDAAPGTGGKVKWLVAAGTEATAVDLSGYTCCFEAIGK